MNIGGFIFLLLAQYMAGRGLLAMFNIRERPPVIFALSNICGVMVCSLIPMLLEMAHIPITFASTGSGMAGVSLVLFLPQWKKFDFQLPKVKNIKTLPLYEVLFIAVMAALMIPSLWRCYYYPPDARDVLTGPEVLAEYAVREHTIINSVFSQDLTGVNNHLKPPFVLDLQIMYKLWVHPFGQLWLSVVVVSFLVWLYTLLKEKVHPVVAGMLMLLWISMPDPYGYTYIILFDYSNMVLFFAGFYFLLKYYGSGKMNEFVFASLMFGFATFIRSETLVLAALAVPLLVFMFRREKLAVAQMALRTFIFLAVPFVFYYIWVGIFVKYYIPVQFNVSDNIALSADRVPFFFKRLMVMNDRLFFAPINIELFGYLLVVFALALLSDALFIRTYTKEARILLYGIAVVYVGMPLLGALIPWFDLNNTTKRGVYKMFPLILLYFRNSPLILKISEAVKSFEMPAPGTKETVVRPVKALSKKKK